MKLSEHLERVKNQGHDAILIEAIEAEVALLEDVVEAGKHAIKALGHIGGLIPLITAIFKLEDTNEH